MFAPAPKEVDVVSCGKCQSRKKSNMLRWLLVVGVVALVLAVVIYKVVSVYFFRFNGDFSYDQAVFGQFGDYIGGTLNPLFSLLGFLALLYTIRLQSVEMQNSTEQLAQSAVALQAQNNLIVGQRFETSFFNMLRSFNEMVSNARAQNDDLVGQKCFAEIKRVFLQARNSGEDVAASFQIASQRCKYDIDSYFRVFSDLIKFIDRSVGCDDAKFYVDIVRSRLSASELNLICYKFVTAEVSHDVFVLVDKYGLLRYMDSSAVD